MLLLSGCSSAPGSRDAGADTRGAPDGNRTDRSADGGRAVSTGVLQHHNDLARDGLYIEPALTQAAVMGTDGGGGGLQLDPGFATLPIAGAGGVYAQPLYLEGSNGVPDLLIVATGEDYVYAFDAVTGAQVWMRTLGLCAVAPNPPVTMGDLPCGGILPHVGVTGTPVIDGATRTSISTP